jgi:hypothetical protein
MKIGVAWWTLVERGNKPRDRDAERIFKCKEQRVLRRRIKEAMAVTLQKKNKPWDFINGGNVLTN